MEGAGRSGAASRRTGRSRRAVLAARGQALSGPRLAPVAAAELSRTPLPAVDSSRAPWPASEIVVDRRRITIRTTAGAPGAEPAVYVHGLGGSSRDWTDVAALLAGRLDGVAVDLAGFGDSDPAPDGDYRPAAHAATVAAYIRARDAGPVHLVGNSLGGAVSVLVAADYPELVRSLTLVSPAMPDLRPRGRTRLLLAAAALPGAVDLAQRRGAVEPEIRVRRVIETIFADPGVVPPGRLAEAVSEAERHAQLPWAMDAFVASLRGLLLSYVRTGRRSLWSAAARVRASTVVVWGDTDRLVDVALAPRTARALPDARLLVLPGVGHTAQLEAPEIVARAVLGLLERIDRRGSWLRPQPTG